jgi:hypothetical protein
MRKNYNNGRDISKKLKGEDAKEVKDIILSVKRHEQKLGIL